MSIYNDPYLKIPNPCFFGRRVVIRSMEVTLQIFMIFGFRIKRIHKSLLVQEIDRYLLSRSTFITRNNHRDALYKFAEYVGYDTPQELAEHDFESYFNALPDMYRADYQRAIARTAIELFRNYWRRQIVPRRRNGRPAKLERNAEMYEVRLSNPSYWTYERLGERYKMNKRAVWEIIKREEENALQNKAE